MNADSFFTGGTGHLICQDHATTHETERFLMAVVSDGCSSSHKSEVGAAILPELFCQSWIENKIWCKEEESDSPIVEDIRFKAILRNKIMEIQRHTGLKDHSFDATIVAAIVDKVTGILTLFMWGDGFIYLVNQDGNASIPTLHAASYETNAPYYFSYILSPSRAKLYEKQFGSPEATLTTKFYGGAEMAIQKIPVYHSFSMPVAGIKHVALFSDGLASFVDSKDGTSIPVNVDVLVPKVAEYKITAGEFVSRRLKRFLKESYSEGLSNFDDFSSAAIIL